MKRKINIILGLLIVSILQVFAQTTVNYTYDALNRITKVEYGNGVTVTYTYDALGNRTSKSVTGSVAKTYIVSVSVTPKGSGSVTGGGSYNSGTIVELNAIANAGYEFVKWSDDVTDNPRSLTVTSDVQLTAEFKVTQTTVLGDINGDGVVNKADLDALVNAYLENAAVTTVTDLDGDGKLTIADITKLISLIKDDTVEVTDGLVAYYPFNGNANDESGNGNNGEPTSNVTLTTGVNGDENGAYQFGGFNNPGHIRVSNSETLKFDKEATFAIYIKPINWSGMDGWANNVEQGSHCIFAKSLDRIGGSFYYSGNSEQFNTWGGSYNQKWLEIGTDNKLKGIYLNKWIHIAYVYSSTYARLYVNGQLVNEKEATPDFKEMNGEDLYMGSFPLIGSWVDWWYPMEGVIDEFRIYNRALNADEIKTIGKYFNRLDGSVKGGAGGGTEPDVIPPTSGDDEGM